ncbi:MAG: hypothetical protein DRP11_00410 [Candidatus Aenigmatarchaeota archaeon]|nr:MAG: hypothetical protein DRP11_00410 [Candidatus Aenigmarchaeota archaeon]
MGIIEWMTKSQEREIMLLVSAAGGITVFLVSFFLFYEDSSLFTLLNLIGVVIIFGPSLMIKFTEYQRRKEMEERFPEFLRNVVEGTRSGMTLPQALKNAARGEYGVLTPYVKKMAAQIDWGIPFDDVLRSFANQIGSNTLKRVVSTIIETHRSGGNISGVLEAVSQSVVEVERVKKERSSHVYSQMITGYTIFFIFLGVMIGLQVFLIPSLSFQRTAGTEGLSIGGATSQELVELYNTMFQRLIIIQGAFSGLAIGKMAEGTIMAGLKHSMILILLGYSLFLIVPGLLGGSALDLLGFGAIGG